MRKVFGLVALASLLLVLSASPSWALWDQYLSGEAGITGPVDRQEGDIHNYSAEGALAEDITSSEGGILGPVDRDNEDKVVLANCDNPFEGFMGEAGSLQPVDRESC